MSAAFLILPWISSNQAASKKTSLWQMERSHFFLSTLTRKKNPNEDVGALNPMGIGVSPSQLVLS